MDEPERLKTEAEKLWTRLESLATTTPVKPEQNFFRLEEIEAQTGKNAPLAFFGNWNC